MQDDETTFYIEVDSESCSNGTIKLCGLCRTAKRKKYSAKGVCCFADRNSLEPFGILTEQQLELLSTRRTRKLVLKNYALMDNKTLSQRTFVCVNELKKYVSKNPGTPLFGLRDYVD